MEQNKVMTKFMKGNRRGDKPLGMEFSELVVGGKVVGRYMPDRNNVVHPCLQKSNLTSMRLAPIILAVLPSWLTSREYQATGGIFC